jgi:arginyl-tRNA synthetase
VLGKAEEAGVILNTQTMPMEAYSIEKILYRFEEVVKEALQERAPHKVVVYLTELAGAFNSFYSSERIADSVDEYAPYKASIAYAVAITLKNGLWALGIKAPNKM